MLTPGDAIVKLAWALGTLDRIEHGGQWQDGDHRAYSDADAILHAAAPALLVLARRTLDVTSGHYPDWSDLLLNCLVDLASVIDPIVEAQT